MSLCLVILASGRSTRFGNANKLLLDIAPGLSILEYVIRNACRNMIADEIIVTATEETEKRAETYLKKYGLTAAVVRGGSERVDSVRNALQACTKDYVLIHDAARPFAGEALFTRVKAALTNDHCVIPVVPLVDTVYQVDENGSVYRMMQRESLFAVQTPQGFPTELLRSAHESAARDGVQTTDDGSVFLHCGLGVKTVEGEKANFKITYPADLEIARIMAIKSEILEAMRSGN